MPDPRFKIQARLLSGKILDWNDDAGATVVSVFSVSDWFQVLCSYDPEKSTPDDIDEHIGKQIDMHHG
jgi:hypothetical protein